MEPAEILIIVAFIAGAGFSLYILTHLKQVIQSVHKWRAASIASLCISAFLFFAISHPKITKVVADVFGAKVELNALLEKIEEKRGLASQLESQIASAQGELVALQKKLDETYIARISKPMAESLSEYQKDGRPVAVFPGGQVAINLKLAAKAAGVTELPPKFQSLSNDSWVVIQNGGLVASEQLNTESNGRHEAAMTSARDSQGFILQPTGDTQQFEPLTTSETKFLRGIIRDSSKSGNHRD